MFEDELASDDPVESFRVWLEEARASGIPLAECMCLTTADPAGVPSARMVLLRGIEDGSVHFFTDYRSRKAQELDGNPRAALVFYWQSLERQVRIEGPVERLTPAASDRYFRSRPRGSRISARTSHQSAPVADRATLERRRAEVEQEFAGREIPRPESWGGYAVRAERIEFWRGRPDRFHDRLLFRRSGAGWTRERLQP